MSEDAQSRSAPTSATAPPTPRAGNTGKASKTRLHRQPRVKLPRPGIRRRILKACAGFLLLALFILAYNALNLGHALDQSWLDQHIRARGAWGYPLFILLAAVVTSLAGPRQLMSFAGGYIYGPALGIALSLTGALIGCTLDFFAARLLARKMVRRRLGAYCERVDAVIRRSPFLMIIAVRLLPLGNNTATSLAAGLCDLSFTPFFLGSALGYLPMTAVFATLGSGMYTNNALNVAVSIGLFAACLALGIYLFKKMKVRM